MVLASKYKGRPQSKHHPVHPFILKILIQTNNPACTM